MGICTSCFRAKRRRRVRNLTSTSDSRSKLGFDDERRPLLGAAAEANARERYYEYETRWANTIQALQRGKIPSEKQLNRALRCSLKLLDAIGVNRDYEGGMSEQGRRLFVDLREMVEAIMIWGIEKNYDSKLQTIVHKVRLLSQAQEKPENDYVSIIRLLLTSTAFRMLATNLLLLFTRHITNRVSSVAQNVETAAENIENVVHGVENAIEQVDTVVHGVDTLAEGFEAAAQTTLEATALAVDGQPQDAMRAFGEGADRVSKGIDELASDRRPDKGKTRQSNELSESERRQVVIETLREILLVAHVDRPEHIAAVRSILTLGEDFIKDATPNSPTVTVDPPSESRVEISPDLPPSLRIFSVPSSSPTRPCPKAADQLLATTISDLKALLQRLAGGKSFDGVVEAFRQVIEDIEEDRTRTDEDAETDANVLPEHLHHEGFTQDGNSDVNLIKSSIAVLKQAFDNPAYIEDVTKDGKSAFTKDLDGLMERWAVAAQETHQHVSDSDMNPTSSPLPLPQRQRKHLHTFIIELSSFITSLENDKPTRRLIDTFKLLETDFLDYFSEKSVLDLGSSAAHLGSHHLRFITDIIGHVLPRIIGRALSPSSSSSAFALPLPLPRLELKMPSLETVVDLRGMVVNVDVEKRVSKRWWEFWDRPVEEEEEYWWGDRSRRSSARRASWSESPLENSMYSTFTPSSSVTDGGDVREDNWFADFLTPRSVSVKRSEEVVIDFSREVDVADEENERTPLVDSSPTRKRYDRQRCIATSTSTSSRAHVKMDGLFVGLPNLSPQCRKMRIVSFENIAYYVNYTLWWLLGYRDEGVLDLDVALTDSGNGEEGGVVDMDIEVNLGSANQKTERGFKIHSLVLTLPRSIHIGALCTSNRHPLLTSCVLDPLVIPLAQRVARVETERVAGETLRSILEEGGNRILDLMGTFKGNEGGEDDKGRWWKLLVGSSSPLQEEEERDAGSAPTRTDVDVSLTGVDIKVSEENTTTSGSGSVSPQLEIAVGLTPQIIPSEAEPHAPVPVGRVAENVAEEVVAQSSSKVVEDAAIVTGTVRGILKGVNGTGRKRRQVRYKEDETEGPKEPQMDREWGGWRSDVFDW
ncbi:hypothetical protein E1B28_011675 [Marasmius oreades]|uniref:HAM1-like N-terminal domain-containing protein n=1 Tax=Marasmius oreades TaxID=181124 RepID=A0A9P7RW01_9AGAR|nr:uncharacterized protein E1B28_011675 [Marasmius oreades]KAG7090058.1 hypothetical protein E1B28_011675 [Marasmius oreades]